MELTTFDAAEPVQSFPDNIPHLSGPGAAIRQVLAAHFVRDCPHIVEIGGHLRPVTDYLTHAPLSVLSVDPKTPPLEADELNGRPCRVRHISAKFQEVEYDYAPGSYGLVLLGYSLKAVRQPRAARPAAVRPDRQRQDGDPRISAGAGACVLAGALDPVAALARTVCSLDITIDDPEIAGSPYARRRFHVLRPSQPTVLTARWNAA